MNRTQVYASRQLAGRVRRYHAWPVLHVQSVGEHCNRVAQIYVEIFGLPRAEVLHYVAHHDGGELYAGDVPFSAKDRVPGLRDAINESEKLGLKMLGVQLPSLTALEWGRFKIADILEMWEFGCIEYRMGNQYAMPIIEDTKRAVLAKAALVAHATTQVTKWFHQQGEGVAT